MFNPAERCGGVCKQTCMSQSSQLAEPLRTDPGLKSGISVRELLSTKKEKRKKEKPTRRR